MNMRIKFGYYSQGYYSFRNIQSIPINFNAYVGYNTMSMSTYNYNCMGNAFVRKENHKIETRNL